MLTRLTQIEGVEHRDMLQHDAVFQSIIEFVCEVSSQFVNANCRDFS